MQYNSVVVFFNISDAPDRDTTAQTPPWAGANAVDPYRVHHFEPQKNAHLPIGPANSRLADSLADSKASPTHSLSSLSRRAEQRRPTVNEPSHRVPALPYHQGPHQLVLAVAPSRSGPQAASQSTLTLQLLLSLSLLPAASAVAKHPARPARAYAVPPYCQISLQTRPLAACCFHPSPRLGQRDT
jgi:hypothetical protein